MVSVKKNIKLRGHHLICLHFFTGEGYNFEFVANLRMVLGRAKSGEEIEICTGPDDICRECPHLKEESCLYGKDSDNEIRKMDKRAIKLLRLSAHDKVKWLEITNKIPEIITEWANIYCETCEWRKTCEKVVQ